MYHATANKIVSFFSAPPKTNLQGSQNIVRFLRRIRALKTKVLPVTLRLFNGYFDLNFTGSFKRKRQQELISGFQFLLQAD